MQFVAYNSHKLFDQLFRISSLNKTNHTNRLFLEFLTNSIKIAIFEGHSKRV